MRTPGRSLLPWCAAAVVLASALGACGGESAKDRADAERKCVVADPEGEIVIHPGTLEPGSTPTRITKARLVGAEGVLALEKVAVPWSGNPDVQGVIQEYPPVHGIADSLAQWPERRPLTGLAITPKGPDHAVLIALRLADPSETGEVDGVRLTLDDEPATLMQPILLKPHGDTCTVDDY